MPTGKLMNVDDVTAMKTASGYSFTGKDVGKLGATEYTLVVIEIDASGSVAPFKTDLEKSLTQCIDACKKSPEVEKIIARTILFNHNLNELHGFIPLNDIDVMKYSNMIQPGGDTALHDATLDSVETVETYSKNLASMEFNCNAIIFIITDGQENASRIANTNKIKNKIISIKKSEILESVQTVLIGVGDPDTEQYLKTFKDEVGIDQFIWIGEATPGKLAKLANFISKSVSSTSKNLGSGAPSAPITF